MARTKRSSQTIDKALQRAAGLSAMDGALDLGKGVASKYGKDSNEYEKAGGTRKSERKRPMRKAKPTNP
jgi:hypothetical protein